MSFLAPAAWALLVLGLPIIALYLIRTRLERRGVSTLLFWEQIKTQSYNSALWRKLRRWLSLLLQLLFLALVVFALARPLPFWQSTQPASVVFVLDPSASMSARDGQETRWDHSLQMLRQRIAQMRAFDRAAILVAGEPPQVLSGWTASKRVLLESLEKAKPAGSSISLGSAVALAENLKATQPKSSIVLFTDGVWKDPAEVGQDVGLVRIGAEEPNVGITHFSARRSFSSPDVVRLSGEVVSYGKEVEGTVELYRDTVLADVQTVSLKAGVPWEKEWDIPIRNAAHFQLKLTGFPADALPIDDQASVAVEAVAPLNVILVSEPNSYLEAALNALPMVEWARLDKISGFPDPKALYIFNHTNPPAGFERANCLLINPTEAGFWGKRLGKPVDQPLVSEVAKDEPIMRHTGLETIRLDSAESWEKPKDAKVFADSFGSPLFYGQWDEHRRWALLAFDLDGSDLVLRTAFPILLGNAVESLRTSGKISLSTTPGPAESSLAPTPGQPPSSAIAERPSGGWWLAFPLWWWAILAASLLLLGEWRLYTRRITE